MKSRKTKALVVLVLLALGSTLLLPSVSVKGNPQKGFPQRVEALEQQVADLIARVEVLEGVSGTCTCDVMHLEPFSDFPDNPSEGDLCVVGEGESQHIYCYLDGDWRPLNAPHTPDPNGGGDPVPWE